MRIQRVLPLLSIFWLFASPFAEACPNPYKPLVEKFEDGSVQLNSYGEGYRMCIAPGFKPENGCGACVPGKLHVCGKEGNWETRGESCGPPQSQQQPKEKPPAQLANTDPTTTSSVKKDLDKQNAVEAKPQAANSPKSDLEAVYQRCKDAEASQVQVCIDSELAKQKKAQ